MNKPIEPIAIGNNVYRKLNDARAEFHSMQLKKSGHNKFAGYKYFELADFIVPALSIFAKHGLVGIVSFTQEFAELRIVNIDNPSEVVTVTSPMSSAALKGCHEVQNLGAVQTYIRRYLWVAALEIVEHDAVDSSEPKDEIDPLLVKARQAAMGGMDSLSKFHSANKDVNGFSALWKTQGKALKDAAILADQEMAGAM